MNAQRMLWVLILLISVSAASAAYDTTNLTSYYSFDTSSITGSNLQDDYLLFHNGTFNGSVNSQVTGKIAQATNFTGDLTVSIPLNFTGYNFTTGTTNFTVAFWVNTKASLGAFAMPLFTETEAGAANGWIIEMEPNGSVNWRVDGVQTAYTNNLSDGSWHYVCAVKNGSTASMYWDGGAGKSGAVDANMTATNVNLLRFGNVWTGSIPTFNGSIDEVGLWGNRTMNQSDCAAGYNGGNGLNPIGTMGPFRITAKDNLTNASINTFNASIIFQNTAISYNTTNGTIQTNITNNTNPLYDWSGNNNTLTNNNATTYNSSGWYEFNSNLNQTLQANLTYNLTIGNYSIGAWIKPSTTQSTTAAVMDLMDKTNGNPAMAITFTTTTQAACVAAVRNTTNTGTSNAPTQTITIGAWSRIDCVYIYNGSTLNTIQYTNGVLTGNVTSSIPNVNNFEFNASIARIGAQKTSFQRFYNGSIAAVNYYNGTFNATDISNLYNNVTGLSNQLAWYPFINSSTANVSVDSSNYLTGNSFNVNISTGSSLQANLTPYATIIASDMFDNSSLSNFVVEYNGTNYTASGTTARVPATNEIYNLTVYNTNYFSRIYQSLANRSVTFNSSIYQAIANFNATEIISGLNVNGFRVNTSTIGSNATSPYPLLPLKAGTYNITFSKSGWYNSTQTFTVAALTNYTYNFTNVYQYLLNISLRDSATGANQSSFTATITSGLYSYNITIITTNGTINTAWANDTNINISIVNASVAATSLLWNTSNYTSVPTIVNITIFGVTTNSFNITIFNEDTQSLITGINFTVYLTGSSGLASYNYTTINGTVFASLLTPQEYLITVTPNSTYSQRAIYFTLTNQSTNSIQLYVLQNSSATAFQTTVLNSLNKKAVNGSYVYFTRKNLTGTNYYTVEICKTDSNGICLTNVELYSPTGNYSAVYKVLIVYNNNTVYNSGDQKFATNVVSYYVSITASVLRDYFNAYNVQAAYNYTNTSNTTGNFVFTWVDPNLVVTSTCMSIQQRAGLTYTSVYNSCSSGFSGTLSSSQNISAADETIGITYVIINGNTYYLKTISVRNQSSTDLSGYGWFFIVAAVMVTVAFAERNPSIVVGSLAFVTYICWVVGLVSIGQISVGGLIIGAFIFILKMNS